MKSTIFTKTFKKCFSCVYIGGYIKQRLLKENKQKSSTSKSKLILVVNTIKIANKVVMIVDPCKRFRQQNAC